MASKVSAGESRNSVPDDFIPYKSLTINIILPFLETNSSPALVHTFSRCGAVRYAL